MSRGFALVEGVASHRLKFEVYLRLEASAEELIKQKFRAVDIMMSALRGGNLQVY